MNTKRELGGDGQLNTIQRALQSIPSRAFYPLYTIWLFPVTEFHSAIIPCTLFGVLCLLSGTATTRNLTPHSTEVFSSVLRAVVWMWFNLLVFTVSNQRLPGSIVEDTINKSWRPLPAKRISSDAARRLLLMFAIPATFLVSLLCGAGIDEVIVTIFLGHLYNDLAGADEHWTIRNLLCAALLTKWNLGVIKIMSSSLGHELNTTGPQWLKIIFLIMFSTMHLADFRDQRGDKEIGRRTMPLVWGDSAARYITSLTVFGWSIFCPAYWSSRFVGWFISTIMGTIISCRLLLYKSKEADHLTWKLWGIWLISLYATPIFHGLDGE